MLEKIFILYHAGGEILSINLSGIKMDTQKIWPILDEMITLVKKPSTPKNLGLHIFDTYIDKKITNKILNRIFKISNNIFRIAFIGLSNKGKSLIRKCINTSQYNINYKFIFDLNESKDWLVGQR